MKLTFFISAALLGSIGILQAQIRASQTPRPNPPEPLPPAYAAPAAPAAMQPQYVYDQKPAADRGYLIGPEQAQSIINRFKDEYKKMGTPRFLIYVNRELVDESTGLKLSSHKKIVESSRTIGQQNATTAESEPNPAGPRTERVASTNIYRVKEAKSTPLADKQTVRDVERLFGRPLRMAGVHLADQRVATQLLNGRALDGFSLEPDSVQARKDREALTKVADVVLEILISSKETTVTELSGDRVYTTPDIQVTAIRLSDSKILGQATAADLIGQGPSAGSAVRRFGVREISEATALSLMEDMMLQ